MATKTEKRLEKSLVQGLTVLCEHLESELLGFCWLTHKCNLKKLDGSLQVLLYFNDGTALKQAQAKQAMVDTLTLRLLAQQGIKLSKAIGYQFLLD
ncbi:hypothetical protein [Paraferrimonas sp. SM1919]|uniref:hypothetical protein n=1 Tax=Paraferrimonas sp. SM1919 TaxID=2662263 RepID=UPI0013D75445|nr:hypothetical protein [Paraferrimonas sp. SM1919]